MCVRMVVISYVHPIGAGQRNLFNFHNLYYMDMEFSIGCKKFFGANETFLRGFCKPRISDSQLFLRYFSFELLTRHQMNNLILSFREISLGTLNTISSITPSNNFILVTVSYRVQPVSFSLIFSDLELP